VDAHESPADLAFRADARAWLSANAALRTGAGDWSNGPSDDSPGAARAFVARCRAWQRTLRDGGWAGITWPRRYGGRDGTPWQAVMFAQEMARYDATSGFVAATVGMVGAALLAHGTDAQRERYLPPLLRADEAWCQLFSEPDAGSDLANVGTRAVRDGDAFVVNGQKVWTSNAQFCDWAVLLARTDPAAAKHRGITFLLLDMRTPGIDIRPLRQITGASHFNEVFLTDVHVPVANVLGAIDGGWTPARTVLASEATMAGTADNVGNAAALIELARERGRGTDANVRQALARVHTDERLLGFMTDRVLTSLRDGTSAALDGSLLKVFWSEYRVRKDDVAVGLLGPAGTLYGPSAPQRGSWHTQMVNRFFGTIGGGTSEVHRNMIAERVLGLPREPMVDAARFSP
jgi:alkylation response protein AidB-like acyl-CoA dehydrogenase